MKRQTTRQRHMDGQTEYRNEERYKRDGIKERQTWGKGERQRIEEERDRQREKTHITEYTTALQYVLTCTDSLTPVCLSCMFFVSPSSPFPGYCNCYTQKLSSDGCTAILRRYQMLAAYQRGTTC